jgi:hypothetical protein
MAAKNRHNVFHYLLTVIYIFLKSLVLSIIWIIIGVAGYLIFQTKRSPIDLILGLPLMFIGGGFLINNLWSVVLGIFSPTYNRGVCIWCSK